MTPEQQAAFAVAARDFWWYAENAPLKIPDKGSRKMVPLVPNAAQRYVWARKREIIQSGELLRIAIPKSRQMGMTVSHAAEKLHIAHTQRDVEIYMLLHDLVPAAKTYNRLDAMRRHMRPSFPKPKLSSFSKGRQMEFETGSIITIESVRKQGVGRAETLDHVHATELPSWDDPEAVLTGIQESVPDIAQGVTSIVLESTCEGIGDYWYWIVQKAKTRHTRNEGYFLVFVPWWLEAEYAVSEQRAKSLLAREPLSEGEVAIGKRIQAEAPSYFMARPSDEEIVRKLLWRRGKIERMGHDKFAQEYPMDVDEAFIGTGRPVFASTSVTFHRNRVAKDGSAEIREPKYRLDVFEAARIPDPAGGEDKREYKWQERRNGPLAIWLPPESGAQYVIGADSASGEYVDKTALQVVRYDLPKVEQAAVWHGDIGSVEGAYVMAFLGVKYNNAYLAPENNNTGAAMVDTLVDVIRVPKHRLYSYRVRDQVTGGEAVRYGFNTNNRTRPALIEDFSDYLASDELILHCAATLAEIQQFTFNKKTGKAEAPSGAHDDLLLALMIALYARHSRSSGKVRAVRARGARYERKRGKRLSVGLP